ncbi:hypothetical protein [Nocardioides houyundeii]|uniref:hypothetical protein n=1 Tax=Nocardioides houyundeii TaxID=2045452 RepID=UPI00131589AD|nr:hypothetical protein [Nocardioides houyundeii]
MKKMKKTVAFYEVRDENDQPMAGEDWQRHLQDLLRRQHIEGVASVRHAIEGLRHYGQAYAHESELSLVIARERDEPPSSLDEASGEIIDESTQVNRPWVEIGVASFVAGTNIFGYVLGGMSAPRAGAVAQWINVDGRMFGEPVSVRPYTSEALVNFLQDGSSEARMVSVQLDAGQIYGEQVEGAGLFSATQQIGRELDLGPEVDVEVILRIRGRSDGATETTRRTLADLGRGLLGRRVRGAQAEVVDFDPDSLMEREMVDLVKHRMATKEDVSVMDAEGEGRQVRIPSAINAISRAASRLQISG